MKEPQISQIRRISQITSQEVNDHTYRVNGAAMEVHRILGPGHLEAVYHEALEHEFGFRGIPFASKPKLTLFYKNVQLKRFYIPDFLVFEDIVVEIKSQATLTKVDHAQMRNSLKCSRRSIGLLFNLGEESLDWHRYVA